MGFLGELRKILEKPEMPAHLRAQNYGNIPWHRRMLDSIRPPAAVPGANALMNRSQWRMALITGAILITAGATWGVVSYVEGAPGRARAAFEDGMQALGSNDFARAVTRFTNSLAIRETAEAHLERGNAYKGLGQDEPALADWSRAIDLDPSLAAAFTARATLYRARGELAKAIPDLDQSIRLYPSIDAYFQRGQVYAEQGEYQKAIADYDRSILERRESPYVYLARSIAKRALGDEEGYRADQQKASELQGLP
jgi:tetratricopeptide (TPR) repeat protein